MDPKDKNEFLKRVLPCINVIAGEDWLKYFKGNSAQSQAKWDGDRFIYEIYKVDMPTAFTPGNAWQPAETMPRDGQLKLVRLKPGPENTRPDQEPWVRTGWKNIEGFRISEISDTTGKYWNIDAWMELPKP